MDFLLFCSFFVVLFFLSRGLTRILSRLLLRLFRRHTVVIYILSFLFLPGVILHELSHLLVASVLFVPTGEVEFLPEVRGSEVKMGSVAVARTDPLRRFLIGVAPVVGGIGILLLVASYASPVLFSWQNAILLYSIFQITNTMFSSNKDMEGALAFGAGALVLLFILQFLGIHVWEFFLWLLQSSISRDFFRRINFFLFLAIGIDGAFVIFGFLASRLSVKRY